MKKTTKALSFLLSLCMMLSVFTFTVFAETQSGTCGDNLTWTLDDDGTLTISGTGDMDNYNPSSYIPWLPYEDIINSVIIENGVTSIGSYAFFWFRSLESTTIPNSVTSIGEDAFRNCPSLQRIIVSEENPKYHSENNCLIETESKTLLSGCNNSVIPTDGSVAKIGEYAFSFRRSLKSIKIPDSVISIGEYAFCGCESLEGIEIPDSVTYLGKDAFGSCKSLEKIVVSEENTKYYSENNCLIQTQSKTLILGCKNSTIPIDGSVAKIGDYAFDGCETLEGIEIPDSVTAIGEGAFSYCTSLQSIIIPDSVTSIGISAFFDCYSLQSIVIPDSVTYIGASAFMGCKSLQNITIPDSVTTIEYETFSCCSSLQIITMPDSIVTIGEDAFSWCESLHSITIPDCVVSIDKNAFINCSSLESVTIPESVTSIGEGAFVGCRSLKSITIPSSVTSIGEGAFGHNSWYGSTIEGFTIYGIKGSEAEKYATENGFTFIDLATLPKADSKEYMDNETSTMPNVAERTTAEELITNLSAYGITATITDKDGNTLESNAKVGTGCKVTNQSGNVYTVIVKGDIDGNGEIDSTDYLRIKQIFLEFNDLKGVYFNAADIEEDGRISSTDYLRIKAHFIGEKNLFN